MSTEISGYQNEYSKSKNLSKRELLFVWIGYSLFLFVFFSVLRLLDCGYHFVDDCDILFANAVHTVCGESVKSIVLAMVKLDMANRFTPVHIAIRYFYALAFGTISLLPFAVSKYIELALSMILLHLISRKLGYKVLPTIMFVGVSLVGYQSAIWWRLGTHEIQSLFLFALGFYMLLFWLNDKKYICLGVSLFAFLLMCGYKESFLILIPFVISYIIYYEFINLNKNRLDANNCIEDSGVKDYLRLIIDVVKVRWKLLCVLSGFLLVPMFILLFIIGTSNYGDFGIISINTISSDIHNWKEALSADLKWFKRFTRLFLLILMSYWDHLKKCWMELLLAAVFIVPELLVFHSSGIFERYLLPVSLGYAYIFVLLPSKYDILSGIRKKIYWGLLVLLLMAHLRVAVIEADYFRWRGNSVQTALDTIKTLSEDNNDIKILSCMYPNQEGDMTLYYWQRYYGYDNVYTYLSDEDIIVACNLDIHKHVDFYGRNSRRDFEEMDVIVMYNQNDRHWSEYKNLDVSEFDLYRCGSLDLYIRPDVNVSGIDFVEGSGETPIVGGAKAYDYDMQVPGVRF